MKAVYLIFPLLFGSLVILDARGRNRGNRYNNNSSQGSGSTSSANGSSAQSSSTPVSDWQVSLIQRHLEANGIFQSYVEAEDSGLSLAPIAEGGSEFELWAMRQTTAGMEEYLIDTEIVGAYIPDGELSISTPDPYSGGIPRTRIDKGFTVNYEVNGLVLDVADAPLAARQVLLDHNVANYDGGHEPQNLGNEVDFEQRMIIRNGNSGITFQASNIPGSDPMNDAGVESFRLFALPDGEIAQMQLAEAKVQVWPLAEAEIIGLEGATSYDTVPEVRVQLTNLYPKSDTWVQVYEGSPTLGTEGVRLDSSFLWDSTVPGQTELILDKLNTVITGDGTWTIEVLTETPFGTERLAYTPLDISSTLIIRGSLNSTDS